MSKSPHQHNTIIRHIILHSHLQLHRNKQLPWIVKSFQIKHFSSFINFLQQIASLVEDTIKVIIINLFTDEIEPMSNRLELGKFLWLSHQHYLFDDRVGEIEGGDIVEYFVREFAGWDCILVQSTSSWILFFDSLNTFLDLSWIITQFAILPKHIIFPQNIRIEMILHNNTHFLTINII